MATASAVCRVRRIGELTTAWIVPRSAIAAAARSACQRPFSESSGSLPPLPEKRFSGVSGVSPCRSRTKVVGVPRSAGAAQPALGAAVSSGADSSAAATAAFNGLGSHCRPALPASIASLASRSASLFRSRGIQVYLTWPRGRIVFASAASGCMSGCLIFQRPDICSTTSLESIRTSTAASGSRSRAARSPAIRPLYSATLLVACPMNSAASAMICPVSPSRTSAP